MLSRIAESLYWVGRYVERAEDTARILDVHLQSLLEASPDDQVRACSSVLEVMGVDPPSDPDARSVAQLLAFDETNPSSIVGSLRAARENARGVREAISSEMWECLNTTYNALPTHIAYAGRSGPHNFFEYVKERAAVMEGLTDSTMSRDDGFRFLLLGRTLERVDMTARLLADRFGTATESTEWVSILRSCSAHEAYLRTYRRAVEPPLVAEFLILDRLFPRSIFHALSTAERSLAELDPTAGRLGTPDEARRLLGRARTSLEFRPVDELLVDLPERLDQLQATCGEASEAIARRYFRRAPQMEWSSLLESAQITAYIAEQAQARDRRNGPVLP